MTSKKTYQIWGKAPGQTVAYVDGHFRVRDHEGEEIRVKPRQVDRLIVSLLEVRERK